MQAKYRGRLARRLVRDMSGDNHDEMIERAREYNEIFFRGLARILLL